MNHPDFAANVSLVRAGVELSRIDLPYADEYLHRAEQPLSQCLTRQEFSSLGSDREQLPRMTSGLLGAAVQEDWARVRELAEKAGAARDRLAARAELFSLADAVYGPRFLQADGPTLALHGVVPQEAATILRIREAAIVHLRLLANADAEAKSFYDARVKYLEELRIDTATPVATSYVTIDLRRKVVDAAEAGDFDAIRRLTDAVPGTTASDRSRVRSRRTRRERTVSFENAFPHAAAARAADLGLTLEALPPASPLEAYLGCCCADRAELPDTPAAAGAPDVFACTCGHSCPPEITGRLRENLDLLLGRPFITSAGDRYLPWFDKEVLMVEGFPETDPDARTPLLARLGVSGRHGVSRLTIENALLTQGPRLIRDIGLDPVEFRVVCIPFDAYLRLAPKYGWGQQDLWTHFDGYQITRNLQLWALVGGYREFGGAEDLCSVGREYESVRLTARLAIVRRERLVGHRGEGSSDDQE